MDYRCNFSFLKSNQKTHDQAHRKDVTYEHFILKVLYSIRMRMKLYLKLLVSAIYALQRHRKTLMVTGTLPASQEVLSA